jgi:hypothetical protein
MTGRNEPCPCGSGKKYKKCCIDKHRSEGSSQSSFEPSGGSPGPMPAYVVARIFERSEEFEDMKRRNPERARLFWTPSRAAGLGTEELVAGLRKLGVDPSREAYLALASNRTSAWEISNVWRRANERLSRHESDFLGIAACELWKRYCPERPSVEMLDDWMQEGYELMMQGQGPQACDRWSAVWEVIQPRLQAEMLTCDSAASVFHGTQSLFNWVQDYEMELHNAAIGEPRYAEAGARLCEQVLAQFRGETGLFHLNFRADLGEFHYLAGRAEEGESVLLALIHDHPDRAAGYARLADLLAPGARPGDGAVDRQRAEKLLEEALARPVTDAADYDLRGRLEDLREPATAAPDE